MAVVSGHGPASQERLAFRRLSRSGRGLGVPRRARGGSVIFEVFRQERKGQPFAHAGAITAPDEAFAEIYAREQYGRRQESVALWLVPRERDPRDRRVPGRVRPQVPPRRRLLDQDPAQGGDGSVPERSKTDVLLELADDELDPRLAQLGVDGDRALSRGGRRVLVDRAERDRPCAGAVRARRGRARSDRRRARLRPARRTSTAARRSSSCGGWSGRGRSRGTGCTRRPTRCGSRRSRDPTTRRSPASPRRSIARSSTTACTPTCGSTGCSARTKGEPGSTRRSTSSGPTRSACSTTSSRPEYVRRVEERLGRTHARGRAGSPRSPRGRAHRAAGGDDDGAALRSGGGVVSGATEVTTAAVWAALSEIPDPEIPVISLVELGVIKDVDVEGQRVRVELTPTFMGCPALDVMTARHRARDRAARRRARGAGRRRRLVVDRPHHGRPAGRSCARPASHPRRPLRGSRDTLQLERGIHRCPWCGSTETRLENIFGPTPCRSIRYCDACRQPFEQFKTL